MSPVIAAAGMEWFLAACHILPGMVTWALARFVRPFRLAVVLLVALGGVFLVDSIRKAAAEAQAEAAAEARTQAEFQAHREKARQAQAQGRAETKNPPPAPAVSAAASAPAPAPAPEWTSLGELVLEVALSTPWWPFTVGLLFGLVGRARRRWPAAAEAEAAAHAASSSASQSAPPETRGRWLGRVFLLSVVPVALAVGLGWFVPKPVALGLTRSPWLSPELLGLALFLWAWGARLHGAFLSVCGGLLGLAALHALGQSAWQARSAGYASVLDQYIDFGLTYLLAALWLLVTGVLGLRRHWRARRMAETPAPAPTFEV